MARPSAAASPPCGGIERPLALGLQVAEERLPVAPTEPTVEEVELIANIGELWARASRADRQLLAERLFERIVLAPDPADLARSKRQGRRFTRANRVAEFIVRAQYEALIELCRVTEDTLEDGERQVAEAA